MPTQQPTSQHDANLAGGAPLAPVPFGPTDSSAPHPLPALDVDAFERAAAKVLPSWHDVEAEPVSSESVATRTHEAHDLSVSLPTRSLRGVWVALALLISATMLVVALTHSVEPASAPNAAAPAPVVTPVTAKAPPPHTRQVTPPLPQVPAAPTRRDAPPVTKAPAPVRPRAERGKPTKAKRGALEAPTPGRASPASTSGRASPASTPATVGTSSAPKPRRGAGFISDNPY